MIKAKVSTDYKDIERIFAGGSIQKEIIKVWSTEANDYVFEAWRVLETEGPLPLTFNANGEPLIDYRIYGNTEQTGTPTPENPIMPIGCGERTENLFEVKNDMLEVSSWEGNPSTRYFINYKLSELQVQTLKQRPCTCSVFENFSEGYSPGLLVCAICPEPTTTVSSDFRILTNYGEKYTKTFDFSSWDDVYLVLGYGDGFSDGTSKQLKIDELFTNWLISIVQDSTAPSSYIPYGYKLPILSNSTVTNIYLGEVQTTRRIKKVVFNGTEGWLRQEPAHTTCINFYLPVNNAYPNSVIISNAVTYSAIAGVNNDTIINVGKINSLGQNLLVDLSLSDFANVTAWKTYLQQQYAAGTPVTVWYVLKEPETGIANEPLMKIGDYADTVDSAQTNVQIPTNKGTTVIDYDGGEKHFITSDGYALVDKNQNGFLLSGSTDSTLYPEKMYIKYKRR